MAATLIDIKARMLLPRETNEEGEEEDPRAELVARLLEYKYYKYMSQELRDRELGADRLLYKTPSVPPEVARYEPPVDLDKLLDGLTLAKLQEIFRAVTKRKSDRVDPIRSRFGNIQKESISLEDKIKSVMEAGIGEVIFAAMGQAFFTLSIGIGALAIFGSYIGKEHRLAGEAISVAFLDTFVAFMAGLIIFPACFAFQIEPGQGPKLVFVTLPNVFNNM